MCVDIHDQDRKLACVQAYLDVCLRDCVGVRGHREFAEDCEGVGGKGAGGATGGFGGIGAE